MVCARCTRICGQMCTGSGRFEVRNSLRPGANALCGGLQGNFSEVGWRSKCGGR
jgi:hypothetical protein